MSLHKFAEQVAANGRGDDSLLVHMTPDEVRKLQQFAEANGTTLTINPNTGLPEAGLLSDLFKTVAPIALGAFLGPGAFGITGLGLSATTAGLVTGGLTTLATGSLSRGLMAGLGAYGGAGLAQGIADAGAGAGLSEALAGSSGGTGAQVFGDVAAAEGSSGQAFNEFLKSNANPATMSGADKFSAGLGAIKEAPLDFAKQNLGNIAAAASPIMAGAMVPTTTKMPENTSPAYIRQKLYDPYTQTYKSLAPVKASEWGDRSFSDAYTKPMAAGGIVALAAGGYTPSDTDIFNYFKTPGLTDAQIAADMQKFNVSAADIARATGTQGQQADYEKRFVNTLNTGTTDASEFQKATQAVGLKDQALADAMQKAGMSQGAQYAMTHADSDAGFNKGIIDANTGKPVDFYTNIGYTAGALPGDQGGLEGLYANINYAATGLQNQIDAGKMSVADAQNAALAELERVGVNLKDVRAATGKDFGDLFKAKTIVKKDDKVTGGDKTDDKVTDTTVVGGGTKTDTATTYDNGAFGNYGSGNKIGTDYLGRQVSIATPGDIITNTDNTRTVVPNIPGRPYGGFTGMDAVKSAYTAGGGSLGYTAKAPETIDEFNQMFNRQTGDSLAAYNYLVGKGAYPTKSGVGEIARPYREATLGYPGSTNKMYNWDPVAGKMVRNPDYVAPGRDASGNVTYGMSLNDIKKTLSDKPLQGQELYDWAQTNNLSAEDIAAATGMKLSDVYAQFRTGSQAAAKKAAADKAAGINTLVDGGGTGGDSGGPGGGGGGTGSGGVGGAGGPGSTTAANSADMGDVGDAGVDAKGGYYSRGKLHYRSKDMAMGGATGYAMGGGLGSLGSYSDGGRLLKGPGDGVSDSIPATIGAKQQPARLADGEFVIPARIVSELGNGSTDAGAKKLYAMMDRVQKARGKTTGKNKVAANSRADKYLPA